MATAIPENESNLAIDLTIIEMMMVQEAKKVLQDTILIEMDAMLTKVAIDAVKKFAEVKIQKELGAMYEEVHVHFMSKVIKTVEANNPTIVVHEDKKKK